MRRHQSDEAEEPDDGYCRARRRRGEEHTDHAQRLDSHAERGRYRRAEGEEIYPSCRKSGGYERQNYQNRGQNESIPVNPRKRADRKGVVVNEHVGVKQGDERDPCRKYRGKGDSAENDGVFRHSHPPRDGDYGKCRQKRAAKSRYRDERSGKRGQKKCQNYGKARSRIDSDKPGARHFVVGHALEKHAGKSESRAREYARNCSRQTERVNDRALRGESLAPQKRREEAFSVDKNTSEAH